MNTLFQDVRFALRQMRRSPGFAATAVLILALGITANVVVFAVLQAMILEPLDLPRADRVFTFAPHVSGYPVFSYPEVRDVREGSTVFSAVAAEAMQVFGLEFDGSTEPVWGSEVSGQYFEALGIQPFLGRFITPSDDDHPGASEALVISWNAWKTRFNANPKVIGKVVRIDKHPYTIVGVVPESFRGTQKFLQTDLFVPMANQASFEGVSWLEDRTNKMVFPIARIKDGITREQAQSALDTLAARIARQNPKEEDGLQYKLAPPGLIGDFVRGAASRFLSGIMGLAGIVLLAACANLGGLFAARTADRARELAIRVAIGSTRWRIVRQMLIEAFLTSILGGAAACVLSWSALNGLARWVPPTDYPVHFQVKPHPSLILVAFLISVAASVLFGLMPLRQIIKTDPSEAIKSGGSQGSGRKWALRDVLLAGQIALCCVTVTAAFVSLRGLSRTLTTEMGFQPKNASLTKFDLSQAAYTSESAAHFQQQLQEKLQHLPGVEAVGYASGTPLADTTSIAVYKEETTDFRTSNEAFEPFSYNISPGYLASAGTTLLAGRDVLPTDTEKTPPVAIVNRQFARSLFHTDNAIGRSFKNHAGVSIQIVGMVADGKYFLTSEDPQEAMYLPIRQQPGFNTSVVVRTHPDATGAAAADMAATVRKIVHNLDPGIAIRSSGAWTSQLAFSFFPAQVATVALSLFGAFGLLLSIAGTFGLASYSVSKRMRELSIRRALGAQAKQIVSAALGRMLLLIGAGSALGLALGLAGSGLLSHIVYQASAQDPLVLTAVALTLLLTGIISIIAPVRRALHADPANLLREE
ncbi:ABC transporter permease [Granulicella sibirica]|uniref:Permease n=1 Tax=Granulicella sibirica TaxID=2479048 RepID=A0A4Q0SZC2_9BACT|nr:ABC transporter permease [Granulicella sibirica]RXH54426.1 hypothetical protein GRAN_4722 [Granulicella sibirica]